jgi:ribosome-binding protein aMBF1 (putative translation factor)
MDAKEIFAKRLKQARQKAGLSMEALADKMDNKVS